MLSWKDRGSRRNTNWVNGLKKNKAKPMKPKKRKLHKELWKSFIIIFFPLLVLLGYSGAVFLYTDFLGARKELSFFEADAVEDVQLQIESIVQDFDFIVSDLLFLSTQNELAEWFETGESAHKEELAREFLDFCIKKKIYDQVRFLDETGMEVTRINYNRGTPYIVPEENLQNKGKRYYFKDTFLLERGAIFLSPFDLNIENGKIEEPLKPMIRFGTPLFDKEGRKRGIILLNYLGERIIEKLRKISHHSPGDAMLLNASGFWLYAPNREDEWSFMFDVKDQRSFAQTYPDVWRKILSSESGQFHNEQGLFTFQTLYPVLESWKSSVGSGMAFAPSSSLLEPKDYFWKVVSHAKQDVIPSKLQNLQNIFLWTIGLLIILSAIASWFLAHARLRRKIAEEELKENEEKYRLVHATSFEGIIIADGKGKIAETNRKALEIFGYEEGELLGLDLIQLIPEHYRDDHRSGFKRFLETGEKKILGEIVELEGLRKNGELFPIELTVNNFIIHGDIYFTGTCRDISQKKKAEDDLRISEERFRTLLEGSRLIAWEYEPSSDCFTFVSGRSQEITGYSPEEWYEKGFWRSHIHPDDQKFATEYCASATEKCEDHEFEYRMRVADGSYIWVRDMVEVISDDNRPKQLRGVLIDITERKQENQELEKAYQDLKVKNKRLEKFQKLTVGRELDMVKLKKEVNSLLGKLGQERKY